MIHYLIGTTRFHQEKYKVIYCSPLNSKDIKVPEKLKSLAEKQHWITKIIENREKSRVLQLLTRINGAQHYKTELQSALHAV